MDKLLPEINKKSNDLLTLARWMAGDFSNQKQSFANSQLYAHIRIFFRPLPFEFFSGIGFYSEQVYDYDLWSPYRQGVHRLVDRGDHIYIENYALKEAELYAGAGRDREILLQIPRNGISRRDRCSMIFCRVGDRFIGSVEPGNQCLICRNGRQTYLVSEVELTERTWVSLDRGFDVNNDEQVWGSAAGPLQFEKWASFADELPASF